MSEAASAPSDAVRFVLDGAVHTAADVDPNTTVLQYLRERLQRTGTKEGCAEGDCGACTVVVAELDGARVRYRAVNSCIQLLPTLDGKELVTVESLSAPGARLHPVQQALVECHGSQCGFCTPGFVMSLFALYKSERAPDRRRIDDALAGNLCRCTGYRPIIDAARRMYELGGALAAEHRSWMNCSFSHSSDEPDAGEREAAERLRSIRRRGTLTLAGRSFDGRVRRYFAPTRMDDLAALLAAHPDACILAGGTDVGLWITKDHRDLDTIVYVGDVTGLADIETTGSHVQIGAAATLGDAHAVLAERWPDFGELIRRFGSPPIRNAATLGGNVANGSPIGDSMPALIALGASVVLRRDAGTRELPIEDLYLDYRKTALAAGEFVERVRVPLTGPDTEFRAYKISKRFDQDISAVCAAFNLTLERDASGAARVREARIGCGGLAATPARARACEEALAGQPWSAATVESAVAALARDFSPIDDMRASAAYRRRVAGNLLRKLHLETASPAGAGVPTRAVHFAA